MEGEVRASRHGDGLKLDGDHLECAAGEARDGAGGVVYRTDSVVELIRERADAEMNYTVSEDGEIVSDEIASRDGVSLGQWIHRLLQILPIDSDENRWRKAAEEETLRLFGRIPEASRRSTDAP